MNVTYFIAFMAGLISFLSPCVLPLIPGYISYISGASLDDLIKKSRQKIFIKTIFFSLGFSLVFISLGSTASLFGSFLLKNSETFKIIAGIFIIILSFHLIGILNFSFMNKDLKIYTNKYSKSITFPIVVGAAFGFGWTPCIGPILGSILTLASLEGSLVKSLILLTSYSLGLAIPFIISGILISRLIFFSQNIKKYLATISKVGGIILLLTGIGIVSGQLQILGFLMLEYFPIFQNFG